MSPAQVQKGKTDPVFFINEFLGMPLHKGQIKYLKWAVKAIANGDKPLVRRFILSCANRWGKSALIACIQLWYLFYKFGIKAENDEDWWNIEYRTANIAPTSKLTQPVFKAMKAIMTSTYPIRNRKTGIMVVNKCKIRDFYLEDRTINNPPFKLFFANNSYIEHLSLMGNKGDTLQGLPYGIITYDEAARSDHLQIEMDDSILGRLLDWTAPLHLLSTPSQSSASLLYYKDLYDEGLVGLNQSHTQTGDIWENEFMTAEQVEKQVSMLKDNPLKDQILRGHFIWGSTTIFPAPDILEACDDSLNNGVPYQENHKYIISIDTAIGNDEMVYCVLDISYKPYKLVWMDAVKGSSRSPQLHTNALLNLAEAYKQENNLQFILETWNGESVRFYKDLPPWIAALTTCYGSWQPAKPRIQNDNPLQANPSNAKKADILLALIKLLSAKEIKLPRHNYELIKQLNIYKEDDKRIPTDRVIALALGAYHAEANSQVPVLAWESIEW
jgi:hypothetical protein